MGPLVPIAMFGWIIVVIVLYQRKTPQEASAMAVILGFLLLPAYSFEIPLLPSYNKFMAIGVALIVGGLVSGQAAKHPLKMDALDAPMIILCFVTPFASSLTNGFGLYDGFSTMLDNFFRWGVFFWTGRRFFKTPESLRTLTLGILLGGLVYIPLTLFEIRMSPQLSTMVYGFFPETAFDQTYRYGGWRPMVFLQHSLMVSLLMAVIAVISFWLWQTKTITRFKNVPMGPLTLVFIAISVLCKSANGWVFLTVGIMACLYYKSSRSTLLLRIIAMIIPFYLVSRILGIISVESIQALASNIFDQERIDSLTWRLRQEDLFGKRAMERLLFGWSRMGRAWPVDLRSGQILIQMVDSLWIIIFSTNGLFGLVGVFGSIGIGPWKVLSMLKNSKEKKGMDYKPYSVDAIVLSLVLCFFLLDQLLNAMVMPIYTLCAGALVSYYLEQSKAPALAPLGVQPLRQLPSSAS